MHGLPLGGVRPSVLLLVLTAGALLVLGLVAALYSGGATWIVNYVLQRANPYPETTLRTAHVTGNLITRLELHDLRLVRADGETLAQLDTLRLRYDPRQLFGDTIVIQELRIVRPDVELHQRSASAWNVPSRPHRPRDTTAARPRRINLQRVFVTDGRALLEFWQAEGSARLRADSVRGEWRDVIVGGGIGFAYGALRLRFLLPSDARNWGTLEAEGSFPMAPSSQSPGPRLANVRVNARFADGGSAQIRGSITPPGASSVAYRVRAALRKLDPGILPLRAHPGRRRDRVNADLDIDVHGPRWDLVRGRAQIQLSDTRYASFYTRRTAAEVSLAAGAATITLESEIPAVTLRATGWLRPFDTIPSYDLTARMRRRPDPLPASLAWLDRLLGPAVALSLRVQGNGINPRRADVRAVTNIAGLPRLTGTRMALRLRNGAVWLTARTAMGGGWLALNAHIRPLAAQPILVVEQIRFRHIDLARVIPTINFTTALSGSGTLRAQGRRPRDARLSGRVVLEHSRVRATPVNAGTIEAAFSNGTLTFKLALDAPAGAIAVDGIARPFDVVRTYTLRQGTFDGLDLGALFGAKWPHTHLTGSWQADAQRARERTSISGSVELTPSTVHGTAIQAGQLTATLTNDSLRLTGNLQSSNRRATFDAAIEGKFGRRETLRLRGQLRAAGYADGFSLDTLKTQLHLANGVLMVDTLALQSNVATVMGRGAIALFAPAEDRSNFELDGKLSDLAPLARALGVANAGLDSGRFTASVRGPRNRLQVSLDIGAAGLALGARRVRAMTLSLAGGLGPNRAIVDGTGNVRLEELAIPGGSIPIVQLQGRYRDQELTLRVESVVDRTHGAVALARIRPSSADRQILLDTLEIHAGKSERWTLRHPVTITYGPQIRVNDFVLAAGGRRIRVDGSIDRHGEQHLRTTLDSVRLRDIASAFGLGDRGTGSSAGALDGEINGVLDLSGPAQAPRATGDVAIALHSRGKSIGSIRGRADWIGARGLRLDIDVRHPKGDSLQLAGHVPLALSLAAGDSSPGFITRMPRGQLALDATANAFRIDMLAPLLDPRVINGLRGRLTVSAQVRGSMEAPELSGELAVADAALHLPRLGATYHRGHIGAALRGSDVRITQARIESGGGRLDAQGTIRVQTVATAAFDLESTLHEFQVAAASNLRSKLSGTVRLGGTVGAPRLTGAVELTQSDFYLQMRTLSRSAQDVELTPEDLRILEERFGEDFSGRAMRLGNGQSRWAFDLAVTLGSNNWLRRRTDPIVAVELAGKLKVQKQRNEALQVFGAIRPVSGRSFVQILGRRFDLTRGTVDLNGPLKDARADLRAEYRVETPSGGTPLGVSGSAANVVITAQVAVDTGKLAMTLGSVPPMEDADVKSYLATGGPRDKDPATTMNETGLLATGASLAVGAALGQVAAGGQKLGFDVIQIVQDRNGGQTLVAGVYVSPPLYLGFRQPIITIENQGRSESTDGTIEFEVEYAALRRALLNFQGAGSEFRLFLRRRR